MTDTPETPPTETLATETLATDPLAADTPHTEPKREGDRIAKLLARAGIASRREVERMIEEGRVKLDGVVITTPATVLTSLAGVAVDDVPVRAAEATRLFAFHKPSGLITAERDMAGRATIYTALRNALPPGSPRVMPIGRLDLNTEGLLLLTNDGAMKRAMELPSTGLPRTYRARTFGDVTQAQLESLMEGIEVEGIRYGPINANMERSTGSNQWIELTLTEGKNREVRRVLEHLGLQVSRLIRIGYGPFYLSDLPRGAAAEIAPGEVEKLRKTLKLAVSGYAAPRAAAAPAVAPVAVPERAPARRDPAPDNRPRRGGPPRRKPDPSRPDEAAGRRQPPAPRRSVRPTKEDEHLLTRSEMPSRRGTRGAERTMPARDAEHPRSQPPRDTSAKPYPRGDTSAKPRSQPARDTSAKPYGADRPQREGARPQGTGGNYNAGRSDGGRSGSPPRAGGPPRTGPGGPPRPGKGPAGGRGGKRK